MIAIGMVVVVFALPLKAVKGDIKSKLKKIDYGGSALTLAWAVLILLPLSWSVVDCPAFRAFADIDSDHQGRNPIRLGFRGRNRTAGHRRRSPGLLHVFRMEDCVAALVSVGQSIHSKHTQLP